MVQIFRLAAAAALAVAIALGFLPPDMAPTYRFEPQIIGAIFGAAFIAYEIVDVFFRPKGRSKIHDGKS